MNYTKTFEVGKKDNERFNFYSMRRKTIMMSSMVFVVIAFMVTLTQLTKGDLLINALLIAIGYGLAGILFFIAVNYILVKLRLSLVYRRGKVKPFKQDIILNESGIHAKTDHGSVHVTFDKILGVNETKHAFYIYINTEQVYVLSKDQMFGEKEFNEVRDILKAGISLDRLKLYA